MKKYIIHEDDEDDEGAAEDSARAMSRDVALQVAFERQILKLVFHLIGYRLWF
jgi:hypothetical protein